LDVNGDSCRFTTAVTKRSEMTVKKTMLWRPQEHEAVEGEEE